MEESKEEQMEIKKDPTSKYGPEETWNFDPRNGQPINRGLHNWKRLFRKPTLSDWITLGIILMVIVGAYFYYNDTKTCRETLSNIKEICLKYQLSELQVDTLNKEAAAKVNITVPRLELNLSNEG